MSNSQPPASPRIRLGLNDATFGLVFFAIVQCGMALWAAHLQGVERTDFSLSYVGARLVLQGEGHDLYNQVLQVQVRDSLFQHPSPLFFEHPPFEALLLSPLGALPFRTAYLLWALVNAAVWLMLMFFLRPYLPWPREDLGYFCLWLLFAPLLVALYQGQSSIFVLAGYAMCFVQLKHKREFSAGLALGLGLFKFQFVLPFALMFVFQKRWKFLYGFLSASALLGVLSFATIGLRGMKDYLGFLVGIARHPENLSYGSAFDMPTIHGFLYAILQQVQGERGLNLAVALASILLLIAVAGRWRVAQSDQSSDLVFAAAIAASLVTGSHMFTHDFSSLVLAMFLGGAYLAGRMPTPRLLGLRVALTFTLLVFWCFPVYFLFVHWHCSYLLCPVLLLFVDAALVAAKYSASTMKKSDVACITA